VADIKRLKDRVDELVRRNWDLAAIEAKFSNLTRVGIPEKKLQPADILADRERVLERVQRRAEEYEYLSHSCAKGSALAVMEEFGLGNMEIIKALSPFPGFGMTGGICGAVTGGLIALGLFFGSDDLTDYDGTGRTMTAAREFIPRFEAEVGTVSCPKIQEDVAFDKYMDPRASAENFEAFKQAHGYARCALLPGIGARIAAKIIIASLED